ncbi:MAG: hypothetical protein KDD58_10030 [Bdellovibrionales bacterium]|nr:hypothetical protein [Bdellovibrionales bacterium]
MSENELFRLTKTFIEEKYAVREALKELKPGVSLEISLEDRIPTHCYFKNGKAILEEGTPTNSDIRFLVKSEAVRRLADAPCDNLAETGIEIAREVLAGNIEIQITGSVKNILTDGYLSILRKAGPDFFSFLAQYGLKNIFKVINYIKKMKS